MKTKIDEEPDLEKGALGKKNFRQEILDTCFSGAKDPWIHTSMERGSCGEWIKIEELFDGHDKLGVMYQTDDGLRLSWRW